MKKESNNSNTAVNWFMALPFDERIAIANKYFPQYAEDNTDLDMNKNSTLPKPIK